MQRFSLPLATLLVLAGLLCGALYAYLTTPPSSTPTPTPPPLDTPPPDDAADPGIDSPSLPPETPEPVIIEPVPVTPEPDQPAPAPDGPPIVTDASCGVNNCHGPLICGPRAQDGLACTMQYMLGDGCRRYTACGIVDGLCTVITEAPYVECVTCSAQCARMEDPLEAMECDMACIDAAQATE